jgi:hypothetical protein
MPEVSLTSEQLSHINPAAEKLRLRREHLKRIGDLAVRDLDPNEDEALVDRTREFAIMKEIRDFGQTALVTESIQVVEVETIRVLPEQFNVVKERLLDFINEGIVLSEHFLEVVHVDAQIDRNVLNLVIDQLRQEGVLTHTAGGYVKSPTGDDHAAWLDATITTPIHIQRSNN